MSSENESTNASEINTSASLSISGDVNTGGGDFIGRDQNIFTEETAYNVQGLDNPYLGLRAFSYEDRAIYAGREQLAQETVQQLTAPGAQQTIIFITGASGSGKSSFVQAVLIPMLEIHYTAYQKTVRHAVFRPSSQPMAMIRDALQKLHPDLTPETLAVNTPKDQINLLVIDQFEELFIQSDASQRAPFCDFLTNLPSFETCRAHILITLRVDYLDELFAIQPLWAIAKAGVELRTMRDENLRNAIQKPLQVTHPAKRFAPELLDRLVQDAGEDAALLPLLQVTLAELWKTGKLVLANYHSLTDAIRQRAETVYAFRDHASADPKEQRSADEQQELMSILLDLINASADDADRRDVRQRRTRQELAQGSAHRPRLIEELVNARLLAAATETRNGEDVEVIDIIHESLIDNWARLREAIDAQRQQLQRRARFKLWLGEWLRNERKDGYLLLTDMQLAEVRTLAENHDIELQRIEAKEFYQRSLNQQEAEHQQELQKAKELAAAQRRRAQTFRWATIIATLLTLLAVIAAGFAVNRQQLATITRATAVANAVTAQQERDRANQQAELAANRAAEARIAQSNAEQQATIARSRQLAAQSTNELSKSRYETAILLSIEAGSRMDTIEAFSSIRAAIAAPWHTRNVIYAHTGGVWQATWSHDESKILTASVADKTARIWDATSGKELFRLKEVDQAIWSQNERKILTTSNHTVSIWDGFTGQELVTLEGHTAYVFQAMWSRDERKILTTSNDKTARVWDAFTGKELVKLEGHTNGAISAAWNQDESKILSNSNDGTVRIWDAVTGKELVKLEDQETSWVSQATWSADESKILTANNGGPEHPRTHGIARIWNVATGKELVKLTGHTGWIYQAKWSKDESKILTNGDDGTVRIWDAATGKELVRIGQTRAVRQANWSADERKILTSSDDGTARIWDANTGIELTKLAGHTHELSQATWSHDESKILTSSYDGTARIWDAVPGKELIKIEGVWQVKWSHDERKILTYNLGNTAQIWDAATGKELIKLEGVSQVKWSHDESKILTRNVDGTVHIWNAATDKELVKLEGYLGVSWANWSTNESKILTIINSGTSFVINSVTGKSRAENFDGEIRIWNAATGKTLVKLEGLIDSAGVSEVKWSQDESKILIRSTDYTLHIWDTATGREIVKLERVGQATLSQDESKILTSSADDSVHIWATATGKELVKLEGNEAKWSHDESKILTSSANGTVSIWDAATAKELVKLEGVYHPVWSRDENKILTINNRTVRVLDATTGKELVKLKGGSQPMWSPSQDKILTRSADNTVHIWDATTGKELVKIASHMGNVFHVTWSQDESKILTDSADGGTAYIWDAATGKELLSLENINGVTWSQNGSKILTTSADLTTVRLWYVHMADLLVAACTWTPRNFTWAEWGIYLEDVKGAYRPTCSNAPIPPDAITAIKGEASQQIHDGQVVSATQRLEQLNSWLYENRQFKEFGVDVQMLVAKVSATATAEALPSPTVTPEPSVTPTSTLP